MKDEDRRSGFELARALAILGGLVTLIAGVFTLITPFSTHIRTVNLDWIVNVATFGFLVVVLGIVALLGSRHVSSLAWSVSLVAIGLLAYRFGADYLYGLGPILVVVGGIVGIVARLV